MSHQLTVIGNPENRRVAMFLAAAESLGIRGVKVIAYRDLLTNFDSTVGAILDGAVVRVESPGEHAVVDQLLKTFAGASAPLTPAEHGEIRDQSAWYQGFANLLASLDQALSRKNVHWMNTPQDIRLMFDKLRCQQKLSAAGISTPRLLGSIKGYDHLLTLMREHSCHQVFVKLRYGSSASGIVALRTNGKQMIATTTVEMAAESGVPSDDCQPRLFNSLKLRRYECESDIRNLIDALSRQQAYVEAWLPKAGVDGKTFDLRVLMIAGEVAHVVVRTSSGPFTNLHLGNARGHLDRIREVISKSTLGAVWETCHQVAQEFSESLYMGIDVLITADKKRHAVLEVNAFGDLLPGVLRDGADTYTAELLAIQKQVGTND